MYTVFCIFKNTKYTSETCQSLFHDRQVVKSNHVFFINLCDVLNYVVVNSDRQECLDDAFRLETFES